MEGHPLSAVRDCLFNVFAATLHIRRLLLHRQPEDAPCRGDRDPLIMGLSQEIDTYLKSVHITVIYSRGSIRFFFGQSVMILTWSHSISISTHVNLNLLQIMLNIHIRSFEHKLLDSCTLKYTRMWCVWNPGLEHTHCSVVVVHLFACTSSYKWQHLDCRSIFDKMQYCSLALYFVRSGRLVCSSFNFKVLNKLTVYMLLYNFQFIHMFWVNWIHYTPLIWS